MDNEALLRIISGLAADKRSFCERWQPSHTDKFTPRALPLLLCPATHGFESYCATAVSDKSCFLSTLAHSAADSKREKKKKYPDPLWADGARHSVVTVSHKQAHGQAKTAINLSQGEGGFFWGKKKKVIVTEPGGCEPG